MSAPSKTVVLGLCAALAFGAAISVQVARDRVYPRVVAGTEAFLYVRSGDTLRRMALQYDALLSDIYWIRALQHYGGRRLASRTERVTYNLLFPLLDLTTTLDPYFSIAYRFGAIFLSERYPSGPARPDQAVALLRKGIAARPGRWQYYMDIGFVYYWHVRDYRSAAEWMQKAAVQPGAPNWLQPLAATMLVHGQDRTSARFLWRQIAQSEEEWLRRAAARALQQLDAMDAIDALQAVVRRTALPAGQPYTWRALVGRGALRGIPLDPAGTPFDLHPETGDVSLSRSSALFPLPDQEPPRR